MKLSASGLDVGYGKVPVLHDIAIQVATGQCIAVVGANGAGKTTLLKTLAGLLKPRRGSILLDEEDITGRKPHVLARQGLVLVPEGRHLFPGLSVLDNLSSAERTGRIRGATIHLDDVYRMFPALQARAKTAAGRLSGGEQQMLAIARALMLEPTLIMLDEPSTGLAPIVVHHVLDTIGGLVSRDVGVLLVEQNAVEALRIASYIYVLERGRIVRHGPANEVMQDDALRRSYLGV